MNKVPRILSFGCSTGEEPITLSEKYFVNAEVLGVEISRKILRKGRRKSKKMHSSAQLFHTNEIAKQGEFDAVFAMSVFCMWPDTRDQRDISNIFSFSKFELGLSKAISHLKIGGYFIIYNSNYLFEDSLFSEDFHAIDAKFPPEFVTKFSPDGLPILPSTFSNVFIRHRSSRKRYSGHNEKGTNE
jgi:SAM-dependent methyltransferase